MKKTTSSSGVGIPFLLLFVGLMGAVILIGCNLNFVMTDGYVFTKTGETAETIEMGTFEEGITKVVIENRFGKVDVRMSDAEPKWTWKKKVWADTVEVADIFIDELIVDVTLDEAKETQTWTVMLPEHASELNGVESNMTMLLPPGVSVEIANKHGDTDVANLESNVVVKSAHGDTQLNSLMGEVNVSVAHGDLVSSDTGPTKVSIAHGDAKVKSVYGDMQASVAHGDIKLDSVEGNLTKVSCAHGDVIANSVTGDVNVKVQHGDAKIDMAGSHAKIETQHGQIDLDVNNGQFETIDLKASFEDIELMIPSDAKPVITMSTSHGDAESDVKSTEGSGQRIVLKTSHGDIRVKQSTVTGEAVTIGSANTN